ncbi:hypothetical protein CCMA1212_006548 [Trichoderma ghanense]|uniref:Uncharacterized protein n=1 Tax=Trichoderma ghanense TaxID=65468 RepID=A0ABY2H390_9HYPO
MDGREELGDISATRPVAAAFSSSLMTVDQSREEPEPEERRGGTMLFARALSVRAGRERERRRWRPARPVGQGNEAAEGGGMAEAEEIDGWRRERQREGEEKTKKARRDARQGRRKDANADAGTGWRRLGGTAGAALAGSGPFRGVVLGDFWGCSSGCRPLRALLALGPQAVGGTPQVLPPTRRPVPYLDQR